MPSVDPPPTGSSLRDAKRAVRERILRQRDRLPPDVRAAASDAIVGALTARGDFADARALLLTLPFGSEWDTLPLVATALAQRKTVAAPRVNAATRMLELYEIAEPERDVAPGFYGIPEPCNHCAPVPLAAIDWVLVPGVAFDLAGRRIGYGGGYYDRLLPLLDPRAPRIAGAFELQLVDHVPAAPHDLRVDAVVTERRALELAR